MKKNPTITITANGDLFEVEKGQELTRFVIDLGLVPDGVVVERNEQALTPGEARKVHLEDGDKLEIVRIVAGG